MTISMDNRKPLLSIEGLSVSATMLLMQESARKCPSQGQIRPSALRSIAQNSIRIWNRLSVRQLRSGAKR